MGTVRTALYLDFDNVFSGLLKLDPRLALRFARDPSSWVDRLRTALLTEGERRWLVLRCYLNPGGWVPDPAGNGGRLYFSTLRLPFTDAGFEVVDCPRLTHTKNGADIRMALDAVEALGGDVRYEEFVIASGDSDMTALLVRLRAADRRVTVLSPSDSAVVLGAIADRLIGGEEIVELLEDESLEAAEERLGATSPGGESPSGVAAGDIDSFGHLVRSRYRAAREPLNLAMLGHQLRAELGPAEDTAGWFGHVSLTKALQSLDLPGARWSTHYLWDAGRHDTPDEGLTATATDEVLDVVARVVAELRLPRLGRASWRPIHEALAAFVQDNDFNLNDATRWARDRIVERGVEVNRRAVQVVAQGAAYGGCPLYREPSPSSEEIGEAFVTNVVNRATAADLELTPQDVAAVRDWFGAPSRL